MTLRTNPTPYPASYYQIDRWQGHPIYCWGNVSDGPCEEIEGVIDLLIDAFGGSAVPADLRTVKVMYHASDVPARDVTEDVLLACGAHLDARHDAVTYPGAFVAWAGMQPQLKRTA